MSARELFDRLRYQVYRPAVTTMSGCANGCGEFARGGGECWKCLAGQIDRLVTSDADPELAYRAASDALEATRAMHQVGQRCEEVDREGR
jgi:hypothetical protein